MFCPACGAAHSSGQAACGRCGQALPPATASGPRCVVHPDRPAAQACSRCGTFRCEACLLDRGGARLCDACVARAGRLPWDDRESLGLWRAWWRTSLMLVASPTRALAAATPDAPIGSSVTFALLSTAAGFLPTVGLYGVFMLAMFLGVGPPDDGALPLFAVPVVAVLYVAMLFGSQVAALFLGAAFDHVGLRMLGERPKDFAVSVRAGALSLSPYLLGLVPLCGFYVFPFWAVVLRVLALSQFHGVGAGKAFAAVLLPPLLLCGCLGTLAGLGALLAAGS